jgi:glycosyltransferase involved in cell wall biosynthesis
MVTFNNPEELRRSMVSVKQAITDSIAASVEMVVVDGGTPNFSLPTLDIPCSITVSSKEDDGIFYAMNAGIELARGEFLIFLNSGDEFYDERTLDFLLSQLGDLPPDFIGVSGKVKMVFEGRESISDLDPWYCHQSIAVRRKVLAAFPFDTRLKYYADLDVWMRLKKSSLLTVKRVDKVISVFEMGGHGNHPSTLFERLRERNLMMSSVYTTVARTTLFSVLWFTYKVFGLRAYYKLVMFR